jgi:hypothetical protein
MKRPGLSAGLAAFGELAASAGGGGLTGLLAAGAGLLAAGAGLLAADTGLLAAGVGTVGAALLAVLVTVLGRVAMAAPPTPAPAITAASGEREPSVATAGALAVLGASLGLRGAASELGLTGAAAMIRVSGDGGSALLVSGSTVPTALEALEACADALAPAGMASGFAPSLRGISITMSSLTGLGLRSKTQGKMATVSATNTPAPINLRRAAVRARSSSADGAGLSSRARLLAEPPEPPEPAYLPESPDLLD